VARAIALVISRIESSTIHHDNLRTNPELIREDVRARFEIGALLPGDLYFRANAVRAIVRDSIASVYREHALAAILAPTLAATAPLAECLEVAFPDGSVQGVGPALTRLTMPWNATGQPVISVPCGFDRNELPIGLSFVGRPDDDLALCRIAHQYEGATSWFRKRVTSLSM
jgi:aspartyl-tRNA(Asn)/glutamyl-tRNA(Gln) amidotransferase subunit A